MIILICGEHPSTKDFAQRLVDEMSKNKAVDLITDKTPEEMRGLAFEATVKNINLVYLLNDAKQYPQYPRDILIYIDDGNDSVTARDCDFKIAPTQDLDRWFDTLADLIWILE